MNFKSVYNISDSNKEKDEQLLIAENLNSLEHNIKPKKNNLNYKIPKDKIQSISKNINKSLNIFKNDNNNEYLEIKEGKTVETNYTDKICYKKVENFDKKDIANININNLIYIDEKNFMVGNLDNICDSRKLEVSYLDNNNSHLKIDLNITIDNKKDNKFIGKKRENEKILNNENIFNNISILYNQYIGKSPDYKLFMNKKGFYEKNITVVEGNYPTCVIYFYNECITKVYLIMEKKDIEDEDEISNILNRIKKNILDYKNLYPQKFSK